VYGLNNETSWHSNEMRSHEWFVLVGLCVTTLWALCDLNQEVRQLKHGGSLRYFTSIYNWMDISRIVTQLSINVILVLVEFDHPDLNWTPHTSCQYTNRCGLREALHVLQALIMIMVFLGLLYFFRSKLQFAVLVHVLYTIGIDIMPFVVLLVILWIGFACALAILFQHAVDASAPGASEPPIPLDWVLTRRR
jgi:hypothetical protein